jgi:iron(III) transport system ATP-binding protein
MVERHDHGWSHEGELVTGLGFDAPSATLSLRSRAEDVQLAPADEPAPPETIAFKATVVDSEFGGRHMDVALTIGSTRVMSRIPAGPRGSWARTLNAGQSVLATMHRHNVKAFDETGKLVGAIEHALAG